jgi:aspartate/methionine/tyrosine aminotransferase
MGRADSPVRWHHRAMTVSRLRNIPGIGVDRVGDAADAAGDPAILRLENLDTDLRPPAVAVATTHLAVDADPANSYLPFRGHRSLREAVATHVGRVAGCSYDPADQVLSVAGGLNGITNTLLATVEPGQEVVLIAVLLMGPAMPSGALVTQQHLDVLPA